MRIGEPVVCHRRPLSVRLGPGIIGTIYDGIQRPLETLFASTGAFLAPGARSEPLDTKKKWRFASAEGVASGTAIFPGMELGSVRETNSVIHRILVPPTIHGRVLAAFAGSGDYTVDETIGTTELGEEIKLAHWWPVRASPPQSRKSSP